MNKILFPAMIIICIGIGFAVGYATAPKTTEKKDENHAEAPSNHIPIPERVRKNLGITFATAEYRAISERLRVPGSFELLPSAEHHYPLPLEGRIHVHVKPLQKIKQGDLLVEIDAPAWQELQLQLTQTRNQIKQAHTKLLSTRAQADSAESILSEKAQTIYKANVEQAQHDLDAQQQRFDGLLRKAASTTGLSLQKLSQLVENKTLWQRLQRVPIYANKDGVVQNILSSDSAWHQAGDEIIHAINPQELMFHAQVLQADLPRLKNGQPVFIQGPNGHADSLNSSLHGSLRIGVSGDPQRRLTDVYVDIAAHANNPWFAPNVSGIAEIITDGDPQQETLSIPRRAIIRDGLEDIFFRRDPRNPDQVIRVHADIGIRNDQWVEIQSGLAAGNEVVVDGIYELKLASKKDASQKGGHFHADGTWHEGEH